MYCRMPQGYEQHDTSGRPYMLKIVKPVYGIPQAGRRFQRSIFPWLRKQGMRQLDESDSSVWVYDPDNMPTNAEVSARAGPNATATVPISEPPNVEPHLATTVSNSESEAHVHEALASYHSARKGKERLVLGVYVDNLQIVHSASPGDKTSKIASFLADIQKDWDVEDEGEMVDILGIQIRHNHDGSITLHQEKYVKQIISEFLPDGAPKDTPKGCLPYSKRIIKTVGEASHFKLPTEVVTILNSWKSISVS